MLKVGDEVICVQSPGCPPPHYPPIESGDLPVIGRRYTLSRIYRMRYGLGCGLRGMDASPYRGWLLFVDRPFAPNVAKGWYFVKVEKPKPKSETRVVWDPNEELV